MNSTCSVDRAPADRLPARDLARSGKGLRLPVGLVACVCFAVAYWDPLQNLIFRWMEREEYSHGFFIPLISLWLVWNRRTAIAHSVGGAAPLGALVVLLALVLLWAGELSALYLLAHLSLLLCFAGLLLACGGRSLLQVCALPLGYLLFAIPVPYFLDAQFSWWLQLVSSRLGVEVLRLFGVAVYLQGNVIDLGHYALQVVDACSGLRYLYPLASLGFLAAYLFQAPAWQRLVVLLSVVPITVLMNSLRIAAIGALVNVRGSAAADGFLHFFEGWVIFMTCALILLLEIWLLDRFGQRRGFGRLLALPAVAAVAPSRGRPSPVPLALAAFLLLASASAIHAGDWRNETVPPRLSFSRFPLAVAEWTGRESFLDAAMTRSLGLSDYLLVDYQRAAEEPAVNLYTAWYASQRKGQSPHSPQVCIPGGGWSITSLERIVLRSPDGIALPVNRAEIELNGNRQLVYYWFEQRGRRMASEYLMKWYLFHDAVVMNRTDGALVRVATAIGPGDGEGLADRRLREFIAAVAPELPDYLPR